MMGDIDRSRLKPEIPARRRDADDLASGAGSTESSSSLGLRLLAAAVAAGVLALVVGLVVRSNATAARVKELSAEVARAARREESPQPVVVREIRTEVPVPVVSAVGVAEPHETDTSARAADQPGELTPEEHEHRLLVFNQARLASCEKAYATEAPDPEWSPSAIRTIREKFADDAFKPLKMTVDCRATLCRLDFSYENAETGMSASQALMATGPWSGTRFSHLDRDKREGTVYLARQDFDIPSVDPSTLVY